MGAYYTRELIKK